MENTNEQKNNLIEKKPLFERKSFNFPSSDQAKFFPEKIKFEVFLLKLMIDLKKKNWEQINNVDEINDIRHEFQREWENNYSNLIYNILSDKNRPDNKTIRFLISAGREIEASVEVLKAMKSELEKEKDPIYEEAMKWVSDALETSKLKESELIHSK